MNPEIFMDDFERTEYGDSIYSSIGRDLTISTRFENNCKMLAAIFELKENNLIENEIEFNAFVNKLTSINLFQNIKRILKSPNNYEEVLNTARLSRNELVHEITIVLDNMIDLLPKDVLNNLDSRLIVLIENISYGDLIISFLLSLTTNEDIPNLKFLKNYRNNILEWVMDRE